MLEPPTTGPADGAELFIPKDEKCLEYLEEIRWANGVYCPYCGSKNVKKHTIQRNGVIVPRCMCLNQDVGHSWYLLTQYRQTKTGAGRNVLHNMEPHYTGR